MNIPMQSPEKLELFDDYGLWHIPFWEQRWFIVVAILSGIILLALLAGAIFLWHRTKKKKLTPSEQALHDLQMLKKKGLCTVAMSNAFYTNLTKILKTFLSSMFLRDLQSNTDHQMIESIGTMPLFDAQKEGLKRIFSAGELIKFARQDALESRMHEDLQFSVDFVHEVLKQQKS